MLKKDAVSPILSLESQEGFYSNLFLVLKKNGWQRSVANLKALRLCPRAACVDGGYPYTPQRNEAGDWFAKAELNDAYFAFSIAVNQRKFLRFTVDSLHFQFNCIPFEMLCALWAFTKSLNE